MTGLISLTEVQNPTAQTIRITEPGGITLTAVSLYFSSKPTSGPIMPVTLELRPVINGQPSSTRFIPGSRVVKQAASVTASTTWNPSTNETKFSFDHPIFIPSPAEIAIVIYSNANSGAYQVWNAELGEYAYASGSSTPTNTEKVNVNPAAGALFRSSNNTTWSPIQNKDLAYKIYKAEFTHQQTNAVFYADFPAYRNLSENGVTNPFTFENASTGVKVFDPGHGYTVGDTVTFELRDGGTYTTTANISQANIEGARTITEADAWGYTFTAGATANNDIRGGGDDWLVSQQHKFTSFQLRAPMIKPVNTNNFIVANFRQHVDIMDPTGAIPGTTAYGAAPDAAIDEGALHTFKWPLVLMDSAQEGGITGNRTKITVQMNTDNKNVAPALNASAMTARLTSTFIDYQDSDAAPATLGHNYSTTLDFIPETHPTLGTAAAKHVTVPFNLAAVNVATSIRVLLDAIRPFYSDFDVYYKTWNRDQATGSEINWVEFSKTKDGPNISNYNDTARSDKLNEYEFSVFDLPVFDTYQIKVVLKASNSAKVPIIKNLRTIATI